MLEEKNFLLQRFYIYQQKYSPWKAMMHLMCFYVKMRFSAKRNGRRDQKIDKIGKIHQADRPRVLRQTHRKAQRLGRNQSRRTSQRIISWQDLQDNLSCWKS